MADALQHGTPALIAIHLFCVLHALLKLEARRVRGQVSK